MLLTTLGNPQIINGKTLGLNPGAPPVQYFMSLRFFEWCLVLNLSTEALQNSLVLKKLHVCTKYCNKLQQKIG